MPNRYFTTWTQQQIDKLIELHAKGFSYSEIARELGGVHSRNSCIGKGSRLGLTRLTREQKPPKPKRPRCKHGAMAKRLRATREGRRDETASSPALLPPPPAPEHWKPLIELERNHCRWPAGEGVGIRFCGNHTHEGSSYCSFHRVKARAPRVQRTAGSGFVLQRLAAGKA
jgi:hypothetical protein